MIKKNRIIKRKKYDTEDNLWGNAITEIHFTQDGRAWASNGEYSSRIYYNPFDGSELRVENTDDYEIMLAYIIGRKITNIYTKDNRLAIELDGKEKYEVKPNNSRNIINLDFESPLSDITDKIITNVSFATKTLLMHSSGGIATSLRTTIESEDKSYVITFDSSQGRSDNLLLIPYGGIEF